MHTNHDTESDAQHEDVSTKVVAIFKENLRRMIAICSQYVICDHLFREQALGHTKVTDLEIHLHNTTKPFSVNILPVTVMTLKYGKQLSKLRHRNTLER
jgi:hypothetical protein